MSLSQRPVEPVIAPHNNKQWQNSTIRAKRIQQEYLGLLSWQFEGFLWYSSRLEEV